MQVCIHPHGRYQQEPWDVLVIKSFKLHPRAYRKVPINEMKHLKKPEHTRFPSLSAFSLKEEAVEDYNPSQRFSPANTLFTRKMQVGFHLLSLLSSLIKN